MRVHLAIGLLAIAASGGCYATTDVGYSAGYVAPAPAPVYTTATVSVDTYQPDLVEIGGGVQVIADYDEPVFYTDNYYWRFYGGTWYRSNVYNGGWVVYNDVPYSVRRIDRPHTYVRYRPSGYVPRERRGYDNRGYQTGPAARDHRGYDNRAYDNGSYRPAPAQGPVVRDHRTEPAGPPARDYRPMPPQPAPAQGPVVRDHRTEPAGPPARDYRPMPPQPAPAQGPVVRDHRTEPAAPPARDTRPAPPAPAPVQRDHRDERKKDDSGPTVRDHRH